MARSNVLDNISGLVAERQYPERNSVFRNLGNGKFEDVSAGQVPILQRKQHIVESRLEISTMTGTSIWWSRY